MNAESARTEWERVILPRDEQLPLRLNAAQLIGQGSNYDWNVHIYKTKGGAYVVARFTADVKEAKVCDEVCDLVDALADRFGNLPPAEARALADAAKVASPKEPWPDASIVPAGADLSAAIRQGFPVPFPCRWPKYP